jgi:hypothetical protein
MVDNKQMCVRSKTVKNPTLSSFCFLLVSKKALYEMKN